MKFYQVKREADNKKLDKNWNIFVGGELFTEKEMEKYGRRWADRNNYDRDREMAYTKRQRELFMENFIEREIPKNKTYWLFGARFPFAEYEVEA